ncbi:hypothetical protein [Curtobacterium sp. MCBD17_040]|uniref:hypothetical protein n=1 Tax=Curtobacterium sp. MCBD17_040 TaxID=2175674 RepID=UPI000DAA5485|nr:hypothetical protein [Curtobacterium sp. MCBD17_040]WIB65520.1 hypothetical protein DEI94_19290 [Curtobacterium sp. MCBD17_040]
MRGKQRLVTAITIGALLAGGGAIAAEPASANSGAISGSGNNENWIVGVNQYINAQGGRNEVRTEVTSVTGGATIDLRLEDNGTIYWEKDSPPLNTWYTTTYKGGSVVWPNGAFYVEYKLADQCGGSGCGTLKWSGNLQWNLPY